MVILVVVKAAVEDYGSTYDEDIVVLNHPPSPLKKMTTKWMVVCLLGLTYNSTAIALQNSIADKVRLSKNDLLKKL